jgi:hypothetical protein
MDSELKELWDSYVNGNQIAMAQKFVDNKYELSELLQVIDIDEPSEQSEYKEIARFLMFCIRVNH